MSNNKYTQEDKRVIVEAICKHIEDNKDINDFFSNDKRFISISKSTFYSWLKADTDLTRMYKSSKEIRDELREDEAYTAIADNSNDFYVNEKQGRVPNPVAVQRDSLKLKYLQLIKGKKDKSEQAPTIVQIQVKNSDGSVDSPSDVL